MGENKAPAQESKLPIKLIIKRKGFEIQTEGTLSAIAKEIDVLTNFTTIITEKLDIAIDEEISCSK